MSSYLNRRGASIGFYVANVATPVGQQEFTTAGTYTFTVPDNVYNISAVCIGAGGAGKYATSSYYKYAVGGGGGGLRYIKKCPVTPNEKLTVVVGAGQTKQNYYNGETTAGESSISRGSTKLLYAEGGHTAEQLTYTVSTGGGGSPLSDNIGGGNGGTGGYSSANYFGGGGGAGGYSGNGGNGGNTSSAGSGGAGGAGGGGNGVGKSSGGGYGGGGVGIYGQGANGAGGYGGSGGSGGGAGKDYSLGGCLGGAYGGGSGGSDSAHNDKVSVGGAVRIIWGENREYPSTNTQNM